MSFLGSRLGHFWKASIAASVKSSLAHTPSLLPNLDMPAVTIDANGLPFIIVSSPRKVEAQDIIDPVFKQVEITRFGLEWASML